MGAVLSREVKSRSGSRDAIKSTNLRAKCADSLKPNKDTLRKKREKGQAGESGLGRDRNLRKSQASTQDNEVRKGGQPKGKKTRKMRSGH
jgi:hypothetical protein